MAILLSELQAAHATTSDRQAGHWIGVHSALWRKLLGRGYASVIREAQQLGFVEVNNRYSVGHFSKSYRLAKRYRVPETATFDLGRRFRRDCGQRIRIEDGDVVGQNLAGCFGAVGIPDGLKISGWTRYTVEGIRSQRWYATRCEYGRLHTTFTGLPKSIRQLLTVDERPAVEVDVSNCQPLIVGILATNQHTTTNKHNKQPTICGAQTRKNSEFLEVCSKGKLYDHLLQCCGGMTLWDWITPKHRHRFAVDRPLRRSDIKRQFIILLFADTPLMHRLPLWTVVEREFPDIAWFIENAKRDEYQELARDCQRFESQLMIDGVAAELVQRFPIVTIHDSIIAAEENADQVAQAIQDRFNRFGVSVETEFTANQKAC